VLATHLEGLNVQRKLLCDQVTMAAEAQLKQEPGLLAQPVIILAHDPWPGGVIGIVAARLVERYGKPAILFTLGTDGTARGSARSIEGLHITEAIGVQKDILRNFGGHPMAAGLGLETEKLDEFRKRMDKTVEAMLAKAHVEESALAIDGWLDLPDISLDLAAQIEQLAPFGPGNERLTLATRNLTLQGASPVGKSGEHVKLTVSDEAGATQQVLWWNGGNEELPMGRFDLAYTIRTSDYKGQKQVTVEFVDSRVIQEEKVEVKSKKIEVEDYRMLKAESVIELLSTFHFPYIVWAEGEHKKLVNGKGRHELEPAETLVIWTSPPSPEVLREALEKVKPQKAILVSVNPDAEELKPFLERLAGLVKFVLNKREGRVTLEELASATGARLAAVRLGLEYLSKRGQVAVEHESTGEIVLAASNAGVDESALARIESQIRNLLNETAAYRNHFRKADKDTLL
jgi:single-stranded-DNA-specific exonuclease